MAVSVRIARSRQLEAGDGFENDRVQLDPPSLLIHTPVEVAAYTRNLLLRLMTTSLIRKKFELLMDAGEAEGRRDWMREHWKTVEADI